MSKSLHYLLTRLTMLICFVALFAVGQTASAERYIVTFNQATDTFYDGPLTVITSTQAGANGLTLTSSNSRLRLFFQPEETALDAQAGIGRIVFSVADEISDTEIRNFASANKAFVEGGERKLVYTPTFVMPNLNVDIKASSIFPTFTRMIFTQAEVYTGYCCQTAQERELSASSRTKSRTTTLETDGNFNYSQTPAGSLTAWQIISPSKGNSNFPELLIPTATYFNFGQDASALLYLRRGSGNLPRPLRRRGESPQPLSASSSPTAPSPRHSPPSEGSGEVEPASTSTPSRCGPPSTRRLTSPTHAPSTSTSPLPTA